MPDVVVVGQVGRDLVLVVDEVPEAGGSVDVLDRTEILGGAVNQAVAAAQLGRSVAVVGVVGDDTAAHLVLDHARADGLDVSGVTHRDGATTALFVDVLQTDGTRRLLEHVPDDVRLRPDDVRAARSLLTGAGAVLVQLAQPADAVAETVRIATGGAAPLVALDGAPADAAVLDAVLPHTAVLRADAEEAPALVGRELADVDDALAAARELLARGPRLVALAVGDEGNLVAWGDEHVVVPLLGGPPADPTGGGDAFLAALVHALLDGRDPATAAWWASAAAAHTVARRGGRPALDVGQVAAHVERARRD